VRRVLDEVARTAHARLLAGLIRRAGGDFERAEDALSEAFETALLRWPETGLPDEPAAWIATVGARRLLDGVRRAVHGRAAVEERAKDDAETRANEDAGDMVRDARIDFGGDDDRLRLVFTCCHPSLAPEVRVALTLNAVSGLDAASIARAFLIDERAMAQRLSRAKRKIREAGIPFRVPSFDELGERLPDVLKTIELVFNEGYTVARGASLDARDLADEGVCLANALHELLPDEPEVMGLLALLLFTDARRAARVDAAGHLVRLPDQDRSLWDARKIRAGRTLLSDAVCAGGSGPFVLRAALSAEHSTAATAEDTAWRRIVALYDALLDQEPSPLIALNRAVAVGEASGPAAMLAALEGLDEALVELHYLHAARGDALARLGRTQEAREAFERALTRARNETERLHVAGRLAALDE